MTGKEAAKELFTSTYFIMGRSGGKRNRVVCENAILRDLNKLDEVEQKLTKYKRVFEIFKYNLEITKTNNIYNQPIIEISCNMFVTPEQCELLEELMKGE